MVAFTALLFFFKFPATPRSIGLIQPFVFLLFLFFQDMLQENTCKGKTEISLKIHDYVGDVTLFINY